MSARPGVNIFCSALAAVSALSCQERQKQQPNVIIILADDLGYGDLSCLGQQRFTTPNIDSLASDGIVFNRHYAGAPVSAPSRSVMLTGLHSGHAPVRGNLEMQGEGQFPMPSDTYTLFDMFRSRGYVTSLFGKWGLGYPGSDGTPSRHGVDEFYGYNCQRYAHSYYPDHLWHNDSKIILDGNSGGRTNQYAPYLIHDKALEFIGAHSDRPFMMLYASVVPHAELIVPKEEISPFLGKFPPETPYNGTDDGPYFRKGGYASQADPRAAFAAMVTMLDRQVGEIVDALEENGIADNTLIIFTSDNGAHTEGGADPAYFNSSAGMRGYKRDLYEGGVRVPMIIRWPSQVRAGRTSDHISAFWDLLPTLAEAIGAEVPSGLDGISFMPELRGDSPQPSHEYLYWEFHENGGRQAVREGKWKAVAYDVSSGRRIRLYNMEQDPTESVDLALSYPEIVARMDSLMRASHTPSDNFPINF